MCQSLHLFWTVAAGWHKRQHRIFDPPVVSNIEPLVKALKCESFLFTGVSQRSDYYNFPWLGLSAFRNWRRYVEARQQGYGSWVPNSGSFAVSWRQCTVSRHGSSARPARSSWSWRPVWSSSGNKPVPVSQGPNASKRPTIQHRYGLLDGTCM